jgi:ABC-2 type transport system permease protein/sodium transport system permease protein
MITLVVMPLIVYPLLALVFQRFLLSSLTADVAEEHVIGLELNLASRQLLPLIERGQQVVERQRGASDTKDSTAAEPPHIRPVEIEPGEAEALVADGTLSIAILVHHGKATRISDDSKTSRPPLECELIYRRGSPSSEAAQRYVEQCLHAVNDEFADHQLRELGVALEIPTRSKSRSVEMPVGASFSLAALLPLILVLMTVTGAVYPAIDLTAGERERGTLETLIAAPIPRLGLLMAKYVAVLTVAVLTAIVNLIGMTMTARSTGLDAALLGAEGLSLAVVLKVLALLVLFAAFFSAILLALTSYARSFKEAQAYIIPLMLVCLMPAIVCLLPGLELGGLLAVTPLANIVLLARDLLEGGVRPTMAAAAVISTGFYVCGAIALAARIFGTDAILYGSSAGWSSLARRGGPPRSAVDMTAALGTLAILFPCFFVLSNMVARYVGPTIDAKLALSAVVTTLLFAGVPLLVVSLANVDLWQSLRLVRPRFATIAAAVVLGLCLWPTAFEIFQWQAKVGIETIAIDQLAGVKQLVEDSPSISPWLLVVTLGIVPGICEELFFRGFLLTALRTVLTPAKSIVTSAALFGLFHVVTANVFAEWRFLPSTFLGLVLGWVCVRAGSVVPGMVLHALHNSFLLLVAHNRDQLTEWGIGTELETHLPMSWIAASVVGVLVGVVLLRAATPVSNLAVEPAAGRDRRGS